MFDPHLPRLEVENCCVTLESFSSSPKENAPFTNERCLVVEPNYMHMGRANTTLRTPSNLQSYNVNVRHVNIIRFIKVHLITCITISILTILLLLSLESSVVNALTSADYIQFLKGRRIARENVSKKKANLDDFMDSLQRQQTLASKQYKAIATFSNSTGPERFNQTALSPSLTYVSEAGVYRATIRNLQQLQTLTITKKDTAVINAALYIYLNRTYSNAISALKGLENTMRSTINPIPFSQPLVSGKLTYFNANSTSIYFRSSKTDPPRERIFMCTGDAFGIHLDPLTRDLYSWGKTTLGRTSTDPTPARVELSLASDEYIKQLACGIEHALVLTNRAIYGWGTNDNGEVGSGYNGTIPYPVKIISHSNEITFINAGPYNSVYIDKYGNAYSWGRGAECQLGIGSTDISYSPVLISDSLKFTKICFGKSHAVGRTTSGLMYYWGQRKGPDLFESYNIPTDLYYSAYDSKGKKIQLPVNQCTPTMFTSNFFTIFSSNIVDFQCGHYSTLALLDNNRVFGWGSNDNGQLGTNTNSILTPLGLSTSNMGTRKILKIFHKNDQSFAIADDKTVWAWGRNDWSVCNLGAGKLNAQACGWYTDCAYGCGAVKIPTTVLNLPVYDFIHQVHIMKESVLLVYTLDRGMGFFAGGKFSTKYFTDSYVGFNTNQTKVFNFTFDYVVPYEKTFPVYDLPNIRIVYSENNFLSFSIDNMDMIMVGKTDLSVNVARPTVDMFAAYSFYNTHDFTIDGNIYYFGGIVNSSVSNRIALKPSIENIVIFNQTLPYPVASGMLAIIDEYLYIFGGLTEDRGKIVPTYKVMRCQLSNLLMWEEVPKLLPRTIYNGIAQLIGEYIYIFGGRIGKSALNADILYASASDLIWYNSHTNLPYPYTESIFFSDDSYLYMTAGFSPSYTELKGISRASISNPLIWEDTTQTLPMATLGVTSTIILNNKLYLFSVDLPQNFLKTNPNVPVSIHSIYFANQTKPYVSVTTGVTVTLQVLDGAFTIGTVPRSCREYSDLLPTAGTGVYWIKPSDTMTKFKIYCDMDTLGGGWTLVSTRSLLNPIPCPSTDYVKPDYSGYTISDDKWTALLSISADVNWIDSTGYMAIAPISTLIANGAFVCKSLSTTTLLDAELYRVEDYTPCDYGTDTCSLGVSGNSATITSYCGKVSVGAVNPFTIYTFPVDNYLVTKANMFVR